MLYLRAYRLSLARDRLLDPENAPRSVKDVSLSLGFTNGGRFAAEYKALFGEKPIETFARNAQTSSDAFTARNLAPLRRRQDLFKQTATVASS